MLLWIMGNFRSDQTLCRESTESLQRVCLRPLVDVMNGRHGEALCSCRLNVSEVIFGIWIQP